MFAMAAPIPLRSDVTAAALRHQARRTRDANQARRLLALAEIYDGGSRTDAARRNRRAFVRKISENGFIALDMVLMSLLRSHPLGLSVCTLPTICSDHD